MSATHSSFMVGRCACTVLLDGARVMGKESIVKRYPDATEADFRQAYADLGLSLDEADTSFNILLVHSGDELVLVDAGEAGKPYGGDLLANMQQAGLTPEAVTKVVITHTHGDHVLGLLTADQHPAFPHATYVISRPEMAFWQERLDAGAADQRPIVAMMEHQGVRLIEMDEPILPGMTAVPLPGHTPGQIGLLIESEGEQLLHLADALHTPMQFAHPEWSPTFDADTRISVPTRRKALGRAADEHLLTLFYHLTFPGLGYIQRADQGFTWAPLVSAS